MTNFAMINQPGPLHASQQFQLYSVQSDLRSGARSAAKSVMIKIKTIVMLMVVMVMIKMREKYNCVMMLLMIEKGRRTRRRMRAKG